VCTLVVCSHGLHVVRGVGHEAEVIACGSKFFGVPVHPVCNAFNVIQVDGEQQRGEGTSLFNTERWLYRSCLIPIQ